MVNKAVVGVIGVILITTLGVGALVGLQGGGGPADDTTQNPNDDPQEPAPSSTATATNESTPNATATPTPTAQPERTAIPGRQFNEGEIADELTERINQWRQAQGRDTMRVDGTTADRLRTMAMDHSVAMADAGELTHVVGNQTSGDRYKAYDLYDACMYRPPDKSRAIYQPDHPNKNQFETIAGTVAGDTYRTENGTAFNEDEEAVAQALFEELKSQESSDRILAPGLTKFGVGVEVTRDGAVYSTVNVCGG